MTGLKTEFLKQIPLEKLTLWDKNFRNITPEAFDRLINNIHTDNKGLENALGDICETTERDNYLLKMEVKNAG